MDLRHGIFLAPFHALDENPTLCFERDLELLEMLDGLGFSEAWIGEHHSAGMETIDSPELFIAAAAERTKHLRFGTGVVSLPYHHPLNVANRIIQLDHMTRGRIMFGGGPGLLASDALMMGIEPEATRDRMAEALDVILRLFRGEAVTEKTEWYTMRDARVHLMPYTHPHPEVCVASAVTPSGGRLAGKYDLGMLCVAAGESAGFSALDTNWAVANEIAAENGRTMDRRRLRIVLNMHLADSASRPRRTSASARKSLSTTSTTTCRGFTCPKVSTPSIGSSNTRWRWWARSTTRSNGSSRCSRSRASSAVCSCRRTTGRPWAATKRSYELYARYVMPHFSRVNANRYASYDWVTEHQGELVEKRVAAAQQMFDKHAAEQSAKASAADIDRPEEGKEAW